MDLALCQSISSVLVLTRQLTCFLDIVAALAVSEPVCRSCRSDVMIWLGMVAVTD